MGAADEISRIQKDWAGQLANVQSRRERDELAQVDARTAQSRRDAADRAAVERARQARMSSEPIGAIAKRFMRWAKANGIPEVSF